VEFKGWTVPAEWHRLAGRIDLAILHGATVGLGPIAAFHAIALIRSRTGGLDQARGAAAFKRRQELVEGREARLTSSSELTPSWDGLLAL
jgi:hypothetical protein